MKVFIKDWCLPPKIFEKVLQFKTYLLNNYDELLFDNSLKNTENKNRCFIVGTGSSIKNQNLNLLQGESVIGVSGLYNHNDIDIISPKYYINPPIFKAHGEYYEEEIFINYLKDMDKGLADTTIMFFDISDKINIDKYSLFSNKKIIWQNYKTWDGLEIKNINLFSFPSIESVSEAAIQVALYLGFEEIYLLGFDHDWFNGLFNYAFSNDKARKHFKETADEVSKKGNIDSAFQMTRHANIFNKYKKLYALKHNIYNANANANTYVDTFPKVKFEELFGK